MTQPTPDSISEAHSVGPTVTYLNQGTIKGVTAPSAAESTTLLPGYEILDVLGRGGMGVVYKARHLSLNRLVALKMILSGTHADDQEIARFRAEAESIARLQHPNIVQIYEVGESQGRLFFALEYVDGGTLAQRLAGTPSPPRNAAITVEILARAVQAAHDAHVVHRDLKPQNVLVSVQGLLKVTDFGLAKRLDDESGRTQSGQVMGTPSYMAPEQARGNNSEVNHAADVYALGAILYEMLTGRPPFKGATLLDTLAQVCTQEPVAPSRLQPTVPRDLETICLKCLEKEPTRRYTSALALAEDLRRFFKGEPIQARPVPLWERSWKWARRRPVLAALSGALVAAVIALVVLVAVVLSANDDLSKQTTIANSKTTEALNANRLASEQIVRLHIGNGERLLESGDLFRSLPSYVAALNEREKHPFDTDKTNDDIHRIRLSLMVRLAPRLTQIWPSTDNVSGTCFCAEGHRVAIHAGNRIVVWDVRTGEQAAPPITLDQKKEEYFIRVLMTPEGKNLVAFTAEGDLSVWEVASAKKLWEKKIPVVIDPLIGGLTESDSHLVALSPDGKQVVAGGERKMLGWETVSGLPLTWSIEERTPIKQVEFNADGSRLLTCGEHVMTCWDPRSGKQIWAAEPGEVGTRGHRVHVSPSGRYLGVKRILNIHFWRFDTGQFLGETTAVPQSFHLAFAFRPNEEEVAVANAHYTGHGEVRIWALPQVRSNVISSRVSSPVEELHYCPDGTSLAIVSKSGEVYLRSSDNTQSLHPQLPHSGSNAKVAYSPNGRYLLTCVNQYAYLWDLAVGVSQVTDLVPGPEALKTSVTADRTKFLVETSRNNQERGFHLLDASTGAVVSGRGTTEGILSEFAYSSDGTRVAVLSFEGTKYWNRLMDLRTKEPKVVDFPVQRERISRITMSGDGERMAFRNEAGQTVLWDIQSASPLSVFSLSSHFFALNENGSLIAIGGKGIHLGDVPTGKEIIPPLSTAESVSFLKFSADGRHLLASGKTHAQVWEIPSGKPATSPLTHNLPVTVAEMSGDGKRLATISGEGSKRRQVHLWDMATSQPICPPLLFTGVEFDHLEFSPDHRLLLVSQGGIVWCLLDAATGERLSGLIEPPIRWSDYNSRFVFSPDGRQVRKLESQGDRIYTWNLSPLDWDHENLSALSMLLAGQKLGIRGRAESVSPEQQYRVWEKLRTKLPADWKPTQEEGNIWQRHAAASALYEKQSLLALRHLDSLLEANPNDVSLLLLRVKNYQKMSRWEDALRDLAHLLKQYPERSDIYTLRGDVYSAMKQWENAERDYSESLKRPSFVILALESRAIARVHLERWRDAADDFELLKKSASSRSDRWRDFVLATLATGDEKAAQKSVIDAWKNLLTDSYGGGQESKLDCLRMVTLFPLQGIAVEKVVGTAKELLTTQPTAVEQNLLYGAALFRAGQPENALRYLEAVYKAKQGEWSIRTGCFLAMVQHRLGKKDEAAKTLNASVQLMDRYLKQPPESGLPELPWTWRVEVKALQREAEALLKEK